MGKRYQLATEILHADYEMAAAVLRAYAKVVRANESKETAQTARLKACAKRFQIRANRMKENEW